MYAVAANTGQRPGEAPPPVLLPAALGGGGRRPLAGKTAGVCWEVGLWGVWCGVW